MSKNDLENLHRDVLFIKEELKMWPSTERLTSILICRYEKSDLEQRQIIGETLTNFSNLERFRIKTLIINEKEIENIFYSIDENLKKTCLMLPSDEEEKLKKSVIEEIRQMIKEGKNSKH